MVYQLSGTHSSYDYLYKICAHTHIRHTQTHAHIYTLDIGRSLVKEKAVGRTGNEMRKGSREWIP